MITVRHIERYFVSRDRIDDFVDLAGRRGLSVTRRQEYTSSVLCEVAGTVSNQLTFAYCWGLKDGEAERQRRRQY